MFAVVHFTVVCLVAKPLNRNEAKGDFVMIQALLLFKCKSLCYHANWILVSIPTRSPSASLQIKGLATKYTTVKWPLDSVIGQLKGQFTCHACVSGQNASCVHTIVLHFVELTDFFFMKTYNRCLDSLSNFVIVLINW